MNRLLLSCLIAASFFSHSSAYAQEHEGGEGMRGIMKELNLSEDQKHKLKELRENKPQRNNLKDERKEFFSLIFSDSESESSLRAKFEDLQKQKAENAKLRFEQMLKMRAILTSEQRAKFKTLIGEKMKERMGRGRR